MSSLNRPTIKTRNSSVAAGIDKHLPSPIAIDGTTLAPANLKAVFTQHTAALQAADDLHKRWTDQLQVATDAGEKASRTYGLLRNVLIGQFGSQANAVLNDFGMTVPKPKGPKTVQTKALAVDWRAVTRAARHTMGKNQKKNITWATVPPAPATSTAPPPTAATPGAGTASPVAPPATSTSSPAASPVTSPPAVVTRSS